MKQEIAVIGLGKFGFYFAKTLAELGFPVIGIDSRPARVQLAKDSLTKVYRADANTVEALEQLGLRGISYVLVSVGDSIAASSMISMYLKELDVEQVWVKAVSPEHQRLLYKLGVDTVIIPEQLAAVQLASKVAIPGFLQYAAFDPELCFQELVVDKWAGKDLRQLNLPHKKNVMVISIRRKDDDQGSVIPNAEYVLQKGDKLVVMRKTNDNKEIEA